MPTFSFVYFKLKNTLFNFQYLKDGKRDLHLVIALRIIKTCVKMSFLTRNHVKDLEGVLEWLGVGYGQRFLCPRGGKASSLNKGKDCWARFSMIFLI